MTYVVVYVMVCSWVVWMCACASNVWFVNWWQGCGVAAAAVRSLPVVGFLWNMHVTLRHCWAVVFFCGGGVSGVTFSRVLDSGQGLWRC